MKDKQVRLRAPVSKKLDDFLMDEQEKHKGRLSRCDVIEILLDEREKN